MKNSFVIKILLCLFVITNTCGCAITTHGAGSWELYFGMRTKQESEEPAVIIVEPTIIDKLSDSLATKDISSDQ